MAPVELLIGSRWRAPAGSRRTREATSLFDGSTVGTAGVADPEDVEVALAAVKRVPRYGGVHPLTSG
ncbi:hypothetical protein [Streptomyces mirabilis]|uniref:hypothetical protein n=1 Tax=Streptomyces mirabilis TaxID=68239 RepID=UPI003317E78D